MHASTRTSLGLVALAIMLPAVVASAAAPATREARATAPATRPAANDDFVVSYWYGPPPAQTTIERYRQIREANFNVVFPPGPPDTSITPAHNHRILDFCRELGLRAVIFDPRMPKSLAEPKAKARIDAIVTEYADHPALMAYFITDEPTAADFAKLGEVVAYLEQRDPRHPGYINLFPTYAAPWSQLGAATYEEYLSQFVKTVDPFVISYDHYPFIKGYDRPDLMTNFALVRAASIHTSRPFWNIAQCLQHYGYRNLTEPELRFQAMQTLAFGGRGLLWYTYWYPGPKTPTVTDAMIDHDGAPTWAYHAIKAINADAAAIAAELAGTESSVVFHVGDPLQIAAPKDCPIVPEAKGTLTVGVFTSPPGATADRAFALVTNRDYRNELRTSVRISATAPAVSVESFDPATRKWAPAGADGGADVASVRVVLPPGGGVLLRW